MKCNTAIDTRSLKIFLFCFICLLGACGYLHSADEVQAWAMAQIKTDMAKTHEYGTIQVDEVQLVRESSNKFIGFVSYSFEKESENVPISVVIDGNKKLYTTTPPEKLQQRWRDQFYRPSDSMKLPIVFPKFADAFEVASSPPFINEMIKIFGGKGAASAHLENLRVASNMVQHDRDHWIGCGCTPHMCLYSSMAFTVQAITGEVIAATAVASTPGKVDVRYWGARSLSEVPELLRNWRGGNDCEDAATLQAEPTDKSQQIDLIGTGSWDCGTMADCVFKDSASKKLFTAGRSDTDPIGIIMKACGDKMCRVKANVEMYDDDKYMGGHIVSVISAEPVH